MDRIDYHELLETLNAEKETIEGDLARIEKVIQSVEEAIGDGKPRESSTGGQAPPKKRRKRRTKEEMEAARAAAGGGRIKVKRHG